MQGLRFTLNITPKAQKRARRGTIRTKTGQTIHVTHKDKDQEMEECKLQAFLNLLYVHRPASPFTGPIVLGVRASLPIPASKSKKFQAAAQAGETRPTTKPDLDNLIKHLKDCCKGVFWADDKQVVEYLPGTGKYYGDVPRWEIEIRPFIPGPGPASHTCPGVYIAPSDPPAAAPRKCHPELW